MSNYYNEFNSFAADWLENLIEEGLIGQGTVDRRSIVEVTPGDLRGYRQCHFFSGIGGWPLALRYAGVPDDFPLWTGSCPCQPFSASGRGLGYEDPRDLWPAFFSSLIRVCRPPVVLGEQVSKAIRFGWLDRLQSDLEGEGYACGAEVLTAAGVGAPHRRERLYWAGILPSGLAYPGRREQEPHGLQLGTEAGGVQGEAPERERLRPEPGAGGATGDLGDAYLRGQGLLGRGEQRRGAGDAGAAGGLGDPEHGRRASSLPEDAQDSGGRPDSQPAVGGLGDAADDGRLLLQGDGGHGGGGDEDGLPGAAGFWDRVAWLECRDGKTRPVEPGTFPLAHGVPALVDQLRAYGNAIVPQVAAAFVEDLGLLDRPLLK